MKKEKKCSFCKEKKLLSEFWKDKSRKDGHSYKCKSCMKEYHKNNYKKTENNQNKDDNGKICSCCGYYKEFSQYGKNKALKDGYSCYCRECNRTYYGTDKTKNKVRKRLSIKELDILAKDIEQRILKDYKPQSKFVY